MKKRALVVAICGDSDFGKKPYENVKKYNPKILRETYAHLFLTGEQSNIKFIKTSYDWYNPKTNKFSKGWTYDENLGWAKLEKEFEADVIFDKMPDTKKIMQYRRIFARRKMLFNPYYIEKVCTDKYETYKIFRALSPRTFKIRNKTELKEYLNKIRTDKVVYKPTKGSSARAIIICDKEDLLGKVREINEEKILQEFVESHDNKRIRIHHGVFDLRVVLSQGKIIDSYIRASKNKNILMSNTALGGKMIFIHKDQIPKKIIKDLNTIEKEFKHYKSRLYTADFVIDKNNRVWLIELNDKPGIFLQKSSYAWKKRRDKIAVAIIKNMKVFKRRD